MGENYHRASLRPADRDPARWASVRGDSEEHFETWGTLERVEKRGLSAIQEAVVGRHRRWRASAKTEEIKTENRGCNQGRASGRQISHGKVSMLYRLLSVTRNSNRYSQAIKHDSSFLLLLDSPELTKLWNLCPNNLEACKSKDRDFLPSLETYFEEAIVELDPAAMIDDKYK